MQSVAFYAVGYGIDGATAVGPFSVDTSLSFSDLADHLDFGAMGAYRWDSDPWALQIDFMYVSLGAEAAVSVGPLPSTGSASLDQSMIEVCGGYQFSEHWEPTFGGR